MKYLQISPSKLWHTNANVKGYGDIPDLPVTRYQQDGQNITASSYVLPFWARVLFLFSGKIHVCIFGWAVAPMAVGIGELFKKEAI